MRDKIPVHCWGNCSSHDTHTPSHTRPHTHALTHTHTQHFYYMTVPILTAMFSVFVIRRESHARPIWEFRTCTSLIALNQLQLLDCQCYMDGCSFVIYLYATCMYWIYIRHKTDTLYLTLLLFILLHNCNIFIAISTHFYSRLVYLLYVNEINGVLGHDSVL